MNKFLALATAVLVSGVAFAAETWPDNQDNKTQKKTNTQNVVNNPIQTTKAGTPSRVAGERMDIPDIENLKKREELAKRNRKNNPAPTTNAYKASAQAVPVNKGIDNRLQSALEKRSSAKRSAADNMSDAQLTFARAWVDFTSATKTRAYYDFNYNFQIMDPVREAFMSLSQKEQVGVANIANQPVEFKNGKKTTLEAYIRMESVNLTQGEQAVFDAFRAALTKASASARNQAVNPALPKAYAQAVVSLRQTVSRTQDVNTVLQAVMAPMDEFYAQLDANPALGPAMAKEFVKPVQTSSGAVKPAEFINAHAIEVLSQPTQDKLFEFVKDLNRLSR